MAAKQNDKEPVTALPDIELQSEVWAASSESGGVWEVGQLIEKRKGHMSPEWIVQIPSREVCHYTCDLYIFLIGFLPFLFIITTMIFNVIPVLQTNISSAAADMQASRCLFAKPVSARYVYVYTYLVFYIFLHMVSDIR